MPALFDTARHPRPITRRGIGVLCVAGLVTGGLAACGGSSSAPFDQQFIDMMVPHHEGAVEMAKIAQQRAQRPEIKQMADAIIAAQNAEISQMKAWRKAWYGSDQTPPMNKMPMVPGMTGQGHGGHAAGGGGTMDMAADVAKLRQAPDPFERAFIDEMIPHHESAIDASRAAETRAGKPEIRALAKTIIADQQREIEQMRAWRRAWYPA